MVLARIADAGTVWTIISMLLASGSAILAGLRVEPVFTLSQSHQPCIVDEIPRNTTNSTKLNSYAMAMHTASISTIYASKTCMYSCTSLEFQETDVLRTVRLYLFETKPNQIHEKYPWLVGQ